MPAVLLFIRQRAMLFAECRDHPVAFCETCRRGYTAEELGTEVTAHARTCPNLTAPKPLARMTVRPRTEPARYARRSSA